VSDGTSLVTSLCQSLAGQIAEALTAVIHGLGIGAEIDAGESVLHSPDTKIGIGALGDGDRFTAHGLKQEVANILFAGKGVDVADGQLGFLVVKQSEFHINSSIDFDWGYYPV
jgi:hypothetical protein